MSTSTLRRPHPPSKVAKRRANSCVPCRDSKSKCSGGIPCTTCQKKRVKPRCYYHNTLHRDEGSNESLTDDLVDAAYAGTSGAGVRYGEGHQSEERIVDEDQIIDPHEDFFGVLSLARSVDEFKQILPVEGTFQDLIESTQPLQAFDIDISRPDSPSTPPTSSQEQGIVTGFSHLPALQRIYTRYQSVQAKLTAGSVAQAWSAFASLARDAEFIGLKEHATSVLVSEDEDPEPYRQVWWLIAELDAQLSFILGRRPCLSSSQDVPRPSGVKPSKNGQVGHVADLTAYMLDLLNQAQHYQQDRHASEEERRALLESELTKLQRIQSKLPSLAQTGLSSATLSKLGQHDVDVQCVLMVIYCQLLRSKTPEITQSGRHRNQRAPTTKGVHRELLKSLRGILDIFDYSYRLDPATTASSWPRCFGMFCAAAMLGIARLRQEVEVDTDNDRIQTARKIFSRLADTGQASDLAHLAASSLGELLEGIHDLGRRSSPDVAAPAPPSLTKKESTTDEPLHGEMPASTSRPPQQVARSNGRKLKRGNSSSDTEEEPRIRKRAKTKAPPAYQCTDIVSTREGGQDHRYAGARSHEAVTTTIIHPPESAQSQSFEEEPYSGGAVTAYPDQEDYYEEWETGFAPKHPDNHIDYYPGSHWVHPPMVYYPPLYDTWLQDLFQSGENMGPDPTSQQMYYTSSSTLPMDHVLTMQADQHPGFSHAQQTSPSHQQNMMMINAQDTYSSSSFPGYGLSSAMQQQNQYNAGAGALGQTTSSPEELQPQMQNAFNGSDRRRSIADLRQQQMATWPMEQTPQNHKSDGTQRRSSIPQATITSSSDDQRLHFHSAHSQPQSQRSLTFATAAGQPSSHLEGPHVRDQRDNVQQQRRRRQDMQQQQGQTLYDLEDHITYFSPQLYHQHMPAAHVVTTGPMNHGGQSRHWGWS